MKPLSIDFFQKYLFSKNASSLIKRIAFLSFFGTALSVFALIVVISVMNGLNHNIHKRMLAAEPHLIFYFSPKLNVPNHFLKQVEQVLKAEQQGPYAYRFDPFATQDVIVKTIDGLFRGGLTRGLTLGSLQSLLARVEGLVNPLDLPEPGEVFMGIGLAASLNVFEGNRITLMAPEGLLAGAGEVPRFLQVRVARVIETNVPDIDAQVIFYPIEKASAWYAQGLSHKEGFEIWAEDIKTIEKIKEKLEPAIRGALSGSGYENDFFLSSWQERNSALFHALKLEKLVITTFLSLAMLIASFSIVSVLVLLFSQKKQEMGLLMSLGFSPMHLRKLFAEVGLLLSFLGILAGMVTGVIACFILKFFPIKIQSSIYYDTEISARLEWSFVLYLVLIAGFLSYLIVRYLLNSLRLKIPAQLLFNKS